MPARFMPRVRAVSAAALFCAQLAACSATVASDGDQAALAAGALSNGESPKRSAERDQCLFAVLYKVRGDVFDVSAFSTTNLAVNGASGGCGPGAPNSVGFCEELNGEDGFAQLLWDQKVVDEVVIDRAFLRGGEPAVLSHQAPGGPLYEYHIFTRPLCDKLPGFTLTREQVEAFEE